MEVHCPELEIENGKLSSDNKAVGTEVTVQCLKNHVLTGQEKVTCQSSGQWTTLPRCRLKCGKYVLDILKLFLINVDLNMVNMCKIF